MDTKSGYQTKQRSLILQYLIDNKLKHITADDVLYYLKSAGTSVGKSTVYRYLEKLVSEGSLRKFYVEEGISACYQYIEKNSSCNQHFHLKCTGCGKLFHVECSYLDELENHVLGHHRFKINQTKTVFYGQCEDCAEKDKGTNKCVKK